MTAWIKRWSLRARLLALVIGLLTAVLLTVGTASALTLHAWLIKQVDDDLTDASERYSLPRRPFPVLDDDVIASDLGFLFIPGTEIGTLGALVSDGTAGDAAILSAAGNLQDLSESQAMTLVDATGDPATISIGDIGSYRVVATEMPDGQTLVTGLPLDGVQATLYRFIAVAAIIAGVAIGVAALAGGAIIRLTLRPLHRVAATATRVSELPLDRGEVALAERVPYTDPRTEVGQVGAAINRMLGHVAHALAARHHSELQVRQFVADASHELRTPLTAIRGYAEFTRGVSGDVPPDVRRAMSRVEAEAHRMTSLVEDLLLLARLDAGRPLDHVQTDVSLLMVDAISDAYVAGPQHNWQLDVPDKPVVVTGDPARLHQVLANLLTNARTHTPPGTTVLAQVRRQNDAVSITVRDNGPGIPDGLLPNLFSRFIRGDTSRSRDAGSTGLGLAIVAAVVKAHGGDIDVSSQPGATQFNVTLPAAPQTPAGTATDAQRRTPGSASRP